MAGSKEVKNRIKSVRSTHQITKAMEIVSTTKFRRYSKIVTDTKAYSNAIKDILKNISAGVKAEKHLLFDGKPEVKKVGIIVMTSDRGLCGSFNNATLKRLEALMREHQGKKISIIAVGKKVKDYSLKRNYDVKSIYSQLSPEVMFDKAKEISENIVEYFYTDIFDEVYMVYNHFISAIDYELRAEKIIPIPRVESDENINYIFEPTANKVLSTLLPKYLNILIFQALLNNTASEHSARKNAMKNATDNAEDMIKALNLQYNRERQAAITQEISEIVGGASAMK